jgi:hypothetical protein
MRRRMGDSVAAQKAELAIDANVILIPEHRHRDLDPALVAIARWGFAFPGGV